MRFLAHALTLALVLLAAAPATAAPETIACPALERATQVEACPTDEQLRFGYIGYCSDNRRLYDGDAETCSSFEAYRRRKNAALWESVDGTFQGYLSCEQPREQLMSGAPRAVVVSRRGTVTVVSCRYGEGVTLTLRTKAICAVQGDGRCGSDAACSVRCD